MQIMKFIGAMWASLFIAGVAVAEDKMGKQEMARSAHDFSFTEITGQPLPLRAYKGRALLVVNTASFCGFTRQYEGLQALSAAYKDRGLTVIGVPANDFGGQEPGSNAEIKDFCESNFAIDFPMTEKVAVKGAQAHPFYQWARTSLGEDKAPRWNVHKYLVGKDGQLIAAVPSRVEPDAKVLTDAIDRAIGG